MSLGGAAAARQHHRRRRSQDPLGSQYSSPPPGLLLLGQDCLNRLPRPRHLQKTLLATLAVTVASPEAFRRTPAAQANRLLVASKRMFPANMRVPARALSLAQWEKTDNGLEGPSGGRASRPPVLSRDEHHHFAAFPGSQPHLETASHSPRNCCVSSAWQEEKSSPKPLKAEVEDGMAERCEKGPAEGAKCAPLRRKIAASRNIKPSSASATEARRATWNATAAREEGA